jgi:hypothetical protein
LHVEPEPASALRIVRMRGRDGVSPHELRASGEWLAAQESLARTAAAPALTLVSGAS